MKRALSLGILCLLVGAPARGGVIEGVQFAQTRRVGDLNLELHRTALLRYAVVLEVYVAGLYLGPEVPVSKLLDDVPRRLEIEYFYAFTAEQFREATTKGIVQNNGPELADRVASATRRLNALYRDVEPGDRYALTYVPGVGTELALNGKPLGTVEGAEFSRAVFSIWFGPAPVSPSLKRDLLAP